MFYVLLCFFWNWGYSSLFLVLLKFIYNICCCTLNSISRSLYISTESDSSTFSCITRLKQFSKIFRCFLQLSCCSYLIFKSICHWSMEPIKATKRDGICFYPTPASCWCLRVKIQFTSWLVFHSCTDDTENGDSILKYLQKSCPDPSEPELSVKVTDF